MLDEATFSIGINCMLQQSSGCPLKNANRQRVGQVKTERQRDRDRDREREIEIERKSELSSQGKLWEGETRRHISQKATLFYFRFRLLSPGVDLAVVAASAATASAATAAAVVKLPSM